MEGGYEYDPVELGRRIAAVRSYRGKKQVEMMAALGVGQSTYSGYEHGTITMGSDKLAVTGFVLDVDVNWLLGLPSGESPF